MQSELFTQKLLALESSEELVFSDITLLHPDLDVDDPFKTLTAGGEGVIREMADYWLMPEFQVRAALPSHVS